jgi:GT2 family glycosyltransferase
MHPMTPSERQAEPAGAAPPTPHAVLVIGMHRSGTSATASALGELGLALPRDEDLLGARLGNERGHFESLSLLALSDRILMRLGRAWDDPPEDGEVEEELGGLVERFGEEARDVFEAAFGAPASAVVWKDPRTAVLLPFWRAVLRRPIVGVLVTRDPLAVARSLARRNAIPLPTALSLYERYNRLGMAGLRGLPCYVTEFQASLDHPERWRSEMAAWLGDLGIVGSGNSLPFDPSLRHEQPRDAADTSVLPEQQAIFDAIVALKGAHAAFSPPDLGAESPWTTQELRQRHDLNRLWQGFEWIGWEMARLPVGPADEGPVIGDAPIPKDATDDEARYHAWLRKRGEATHVGAGQGLPKAATRPDGGGRDGSGGGRPRFSVVVPAYRTPLWAIDRCAGSVLRQDFASWELVIVDDASGDAALSDRLRRIASADPRVVVRTRLENGGISAATNEGVAVSRGEWLVNLDHDDELPPWALRRLAAALDGAPAARLVYSDEDKIDESGRRHMPAFKPDWSPDLLLSNAYMCHVLVVRRDLFDEVGGLRSEFDGAQDYDLMLRATERLRPEEIVHVPEILYHWRTLAGSASGDPSAKPWAFEAGRRAVEDAVRRRGIEATVESHPRVPGSYFVRRTVVGRPLVSIIVPFRDEPALLAACYRSFLASPGHEEFELLLVDNDSALPETKAVTARLARDPRVRLLEAPGPFNWVKINNEATGKARGDLLLFMNNDVEARSAGWLAHLVAQAQREEVGAVGARLLFPDGTIQHGGVAVGLCWGAAHIQQGLEGSRPGYLSSVSVVRNTSAVTGACLMSRRAVFESMGGFDELLPVAFNDIDYCLRLREAGYLVVYTPLAELVHYESKSRGHTDDAKELPYFRKRWRDVLLNGDPYYNPNLGRFDSFCRLPNEEDEERWQTFQSMLDGSLTS